ncbi:hypothetical protein X12_001178 [Xanthomonas arboricola]|nr:hypothetical protein X12_001178 [Xanthomonas arboricola]
MTLKCHTCEGDVDCRVGYSNRRLQPLSFACPHCSTVLGITLDISDAPESSFTFNSCDISPEQASPFNMTNPFIDLHLDFPVRFGNYVMGMTPFMMALHQVSAEHEIDAHEIMSVHGTRLRKLNYIAENSAQVKTIIGLYEGKNKQLFLKRVSEFLGCNLNNSLKPEDINAALYFFISWVFEPFIHQTEVSEIVEGFNNISPSLPRESMNELLAQLYDTAFLKNLQSDLLKLYPRVYEAEVALRPALFLDLIPSYEKAKSPARVSSKDFESYKDLYKDMIEVFSRQLVVVAALNNLIKRGGCNKFKEISGAALSSLDKFTGKNFSDRFKYLDDCWYIFDQDAIDSGVRNSIAHFNFKYEPVTQLITCYPDGGGFNEKSSVDMYFLDFMRMILNLFREIHNIHHIIKCLFYYEFLVRSKQ